MPEEGARPLLGVAGPWGPAEIELARRFDDLHQLIYRRGGIRPSNAAVEEVAKLILIRLWSLREAPLLFRDGHTAEFRSAFAAALMDPALMAVDPAGRRHPVWPRDEPFRLRDETVLAAASALVAEIVTGEAMTVADPLGTAFDALLAGRYDHAGGLGTYLTPSAVARMMAEIAVDLIGETDPLDRGAPGFGDPCCGTGRFLVAALEVLRERETAATAAMLDAGAFGADQSPAAVAKATITMLLYGVRPPLVWTVPDSVTDVHLAGLSGRVPLILTNPPFGEGKYDSPDGLDFTAELMPGLAGRPRIDPSLACLARSIRLLAPGGVLGIVLPDGVLSSPVVADLLAGDDAGASVVANVSLPTATFALAGTVAKTSAVFVRKARRPKHVALARVEHVGYLRQAGRAAPDPQGSQLPQLSGLIRRGLAAAGTATVSIASDDPLVAIVAAESVPSLDPARLDPDALTARRSLADRGGIELRELLTARRAARARQAGRPFVSVLHVDELGTIDWHAANHNVPATPGLVVADGDVIVSLLNPAKLRAAVVPAGTGTLQVSAEFGVFRAACDPYAVVGILHAEPVRAQLRPLGTGTSSSRRRIDADDVLSLIVPKLTDAALDELAAAVRDATNRVDEGRDRLVRQFAAVAS